MIMPPSITMLIARRVSKAAGILNKGIPGIDTPNKLYSQEENIWMEQWGCKECLMT